jgi:hypothetical protein
MPRSGAGPVTGLPPTVTDPWSWSRAPATIRSSVLLPQPDGPSRQTSSPARTSRSTPASATVRLPARLNVLPTPLSTTFAARPASQGPGDAAPSVAAPPGSVSALTGSA